MPELVPAIYQGPFSPAQMPDGRVVYPGEETLVTTEDLKSSHWKPVKATKTKPGATTVPEPAKPDPTPEPAVAPPVPDMPNPEGTAG